MAPPMFKPQFRVNITHGGTSTDYIGQYFTNIQVKRRENNYDTASLSCHNPKSYFYNSKIDVLDEIKIYFKNISDVAWTQCFGGYIKQANPLISRGGSILALQCKGYGSVLEKTHCNRDYGAESSNSGIDTIKEIAVDLVDNMINESLGSDVSTGWGIGKTKIADLYAAFPLKYINNPYRSNLEVVNLLCNVSSAIGGGSTAGGHWIVDNSKNLIIDTIGDHTYTYEWPNWWNTDQTGSTLIQGIDFTEIGALDKAEEYANKVVLVTDFRKPAYDSWTNGRAAEWGNYNSLTLSDESTIKVVGSNSLKIATASNGNGEAYWPSGDDAAWNIEKWGSAKTIPTLNFYMYHASDASTGACLIKMNTARATDYFKILLNVYSDPADEWVHHSIPIGPYWATKNEERRYRWDGSVGTPLWSNINSVGFYLIGTGIPPAATELYIDDLHFTGKISRSAKNSTAITSVHEHQMLIIGRDALDDSCVAADDTGIAARVAYAELLRRQSLPYTVSFTTALKPSMMAGQKAHIHAFKKYDGSFTVNADMRLLEVEHNFNTTAKLATTTATATSDLLNSFPISATNQYSIMIENLLLNSGEAKNMRANSEVDLLIPVLELDYPS